jgi:hypothetical protein
MIMINLEQLQLEIARLRPDDNIEHILAVLLGSVYGVITELMAVEAVLSRKGFITGASDDQKPS